MRNIKISAGLFNPDENDNDRWQQFKEQCGDDEQAIQNAIGRLSMWAWDMYPFVQINLNGKAGEMELVAVYKKEEDQERPSYVIGAIWHDNHFGFHS